jgi:gamma-glutamylcyclotransferase (GGCT)/AIG2-like uncharacterized protein YtfP
VKPLFGYGTFRKSAWRDAILGAAYPAQPATLRGYRRVSTRSGYLSLRETLFEVSLIEGVLVELDEVGWRIADRWEEVPKYQRVETVVNTMHGALAALMYVCSESDGTPVDGDPAALLTDAEVEASIAIFSGEMRHIRRTFEPPAS